MAGRRRVQSSRFWSAALVVAWLGVVGVCGAAAVAEPAPKLRHPAILVSAHAAALTWFVAAAVMLCVRPGEWVPLSPRLRVARLAWALGAAMLVLHGVFAFWLGHGWSHEAAVEHTRQAGGFGWGIVFNYLFAAMWAADAAWWWASPGGYAARPRWVGRLVHGFLAVVVFNATVAFGPTGSRYGYAVASVALGLLWGWRKWRSRWGEE